MPQKYNFDKETPTMILFVNFLLLLSFLFNNNCEQLNERLIKACAKDTFNRTCLFLERRDLHCQTALDKNVVFHYGMHFCCCNLV